VTTVYTSLVGRDVVSLLADLDPLTYVDFGPGLVEIVDIEAAYDLDEGEDGSIVDPDGLGPLWIVVAGEHFAVSEDDPEAEAALLWSVKHGKWWSGRHGYCDELHEGCLVDPEYAANRVAESRWPGKPHRVAVTVQLGER
jgi:hypothetical protein